MRKTYLLMKPFCFVLLLLILITSNSCRKEILVNNEHSNEPFDRFAWQLSRLDQTNIIKPEELKKWVKDNLPTGLQSQVHFNSTEQNVLNGLHVIRVPVSDGGYLYFAKEKSKLMVWLYNSVDKSGGTPTYTGDIVSYSFQTGKVYGFVYDKDKILRWGVMNVGLPQVNKSNKYQTNATGYWAVLWCILTGRDWDANTRISGVCASGSIFTEIAQKSVDFFGSLFISGGGGGGGGGNYEGGSNSAPVVTESYYLGVGSPMQGPDGSGSYVIQPGVPNGTLPEFGGTSLWVSKKMPNDPATCLDGYTTMPRLGPDGCPIDLPIVWQTVEVPVSTYRPYLDDEPFVFETVTVPGSNITYTYRDITAAYDNDPVFVQKYFAGDVDENYPLPPVMWPFVLRWNIDRETTILKQKHPDWSDAKILSLATWNVLGGAVHFTLDMVGMVPVVGEPADIINGAIYFVEGDRINCALSVASTLPVYGWVSTGGKWVKEAISAAPLAQAAGKVAYKAIKAGGDVRFVKVIVSSFSHANVKLLKAIKPADVTLTNISRTLVDQEGMRLVPPDGYLKNIVDDIIQFGDDLGTKTELLADNYFASDGFLKYDAKFGSNNGFDGVYIKGTLDNPTEIIINEAKPLKNTGNVKLNPANDPTGLPAQMSDNWLKNVFDRMIESSDPAINNLGNRLNQEFFAHPEKFTKTITVVDKTTGELVFLRLGSY